MTETETETEQVFDGPLAKAEWAQPAVLSGPQRVFIEGLLLVLVYVTIINLFVEYADSVVIDAHKMMFVPGLCAFVLKVFRRSPVTIVSYRSREESERLKKRLQA